MKSPGEARCYSVTVISIEKAPVMNDDSGGWDWSQTVGDVRHSPIDRARQDN